MYNMILSRMYGLYVCIRTDLMEQKILFRHYHIEPYMGLGYCFRITISQQRSRHYI